MKASGSPCPLDKISTIRFKRCPYLCSYITEVIRLIWISGNVPDEWKKACTVLMHKKGDTRDASNFRSITLESVPLKIFTSCLRDSMFSFLRSNGYIKHNIQKGFLSKLTVTSDHTTQMSNIINKARVKQRSLVITLLDLNNAFSEVRNNLIPKYCAIIALHNIFKTWLRVSIVTSKPPYYYFISNPFPKGRNRRSSMRLPHPSHA